MSDNIKLFTFTWKIENFSMLPHQKGEVLESEKFGVPIWKETEWHLTLYPRGDDEPKSAGYVSLFFRKIPADTELKLNFTFALESTDSTSENIIVQVNKITTIGWGYSTFINLIDIYKNNIFLPNDILTLRFELSQADENFAEEKVINKPMCAQCLMTRKCMSRTSIQVHRRCMMWHIENINKSSEVEESSIRLESVLKESPGLKMSCNWSKMSPDDYVKIEIRQTWPPLSDEGLFVKCKITVVTADKEYQDSEESTHFFSLEPDDDGVWYFPEFIKTSHMTSDKYLYIEDTLLLQCEFSFSYKNNIYHSEFNCMPPTFKSNERCIKPKCISLEGLYIQEKFCDVHLQAGGKVFPAYKIFLCARSSVFTAMFEHDMKEKKTNVIEITDIEPTTLKRMIDFIHIDDIKEELSHEDACKLYKAADKYNIDCLKRMCSILLTSALSVENVCDVLSLADAYNDNFLMTVAYTFIATYSIETFHSTHWESFMENHPKLSMKIMHHWIKGDSSEIKKYWY